MVPDWMRRFLKNPAGPGTYTYHSTPPDGPRERRSFKGEPGTVTVRAVCKDCNNVWMSRTEGAAQPYLTSMLRNHARTFYTAGQTAIATWMIMAGLVTASKLKPPLDPQFYTHIYEQRQPSHRTRVWLAATPYWDFSNLETRGILIQERDEAPPDASQAYCALIVVGKMVGFVISWLPDDPELGPYLEWDLVARYAPALTPVWPTARAAQWPPPGGRLSDAELTDLLECVIAYPPT